MEIAYLRDFVGREASARSVSGLEGKASRRWGLNFLRF